MGRETERDAVIYGEVVVGGEGQASGDAGNRQMRNYINIARPV